jgi:hypothetical protein
MNLHAQSVSEGTEKWLYTQIKSSKFSGSFSRDFSEEIRKHGRSNNLTELLSKIQSLLRWIEKYEDKPDIAIRSERKLRMLEQAVRSAISRL